MSCAVEVYVGHWLMPFTPRALIISYGFWSDCPRTALSTVEGDGGVGEWSCERVVENMFYCRYVSRMPDLGVLLTRVQSWLIIALMGKWLPKLQLPPLQNIITALQVVVRIYSRCAASARGSVMLVLFFFFFSSEAADCVLLLKAVQCFGYSLIDIIFLRWVVCLWPWIFL